MGCRSLLSLSLALARRPTSIAAGARSVYIKPKPEPIKLSKFDIDKQVVVLLHDYANVPENKVNLHANFVHDLLIDSLDRFGFYTDVLEKFQIKMDVERRFNRDFKSGREAADWIAAIFEGEGRLIC